MVERFNNYTLTRPKLRKVFGWSLIVFGFIALITPLTPGGLLFFVGLELIGVRFAFTDKIKHLLKRKKTDPPISESSLCETST
jgi:small-conductance mechanosensitive channel